MFQLISEAAKLAVARLTRVQLTGDVGTDAKGQFFLLVVVTCPGPAAAPDPGSGAPCPGLGSGPAILAFHLLLLPKTSFAGFLPL